MLIKIENDSSENINALPSTYTVGIDFGTTNSLACWVGGTAEQVVFAKFYEDSVMLPSVVAFLNDESILIGDSALGRSNCIKSVKRLFNEPTVTSSTLQTARHIAREIINSINKTIPQVGGNVKSVVVSVPAYFGSTAKRLIKQVFEMEGVVVRRLIQEPTAAAIFHCINSLEEVKSLAVYDLGGGTFDVSILHSTGNTFYVAGLAGDPSLGGDDIDMLLEKELRQKITMIGLDQDFINKELTVAIKKLLSVTEISMLQISSIQTKEGSFFRWDVGIMQGGIGNFTSSTQGYYTSNAKLENIIDSKLIGAVTISRDELENIAEPLISKTINITKNALSKSPIEVDTVVLVGGGAHMPIIRHKLAEIFKNVIFNPHWCEKSVVVGAGIQAAILDERLPSKTIRDVVPLSIGVETFGGGVDFIIDRNSFLPSSGSAKFTTVANNQTSIAFTIVEGGRALVKHCRKLGKFSFKKLDSSLAGSQSVQLTLTIDVDGLLTASAKNLTTGEEEQFEIVEATTQNAEQIKQTLRDSISHGQEDLLEVRKINATNDAIITITHATKILNELPKTEQTNKADKALNDLRSSINQPSVMAIRKAKLDLEEIMKPLLDLYIKNKINTDR